MLALNELNIRITRGDTAWLMIQLSGDVPADGTEAVITLKRGQLEATPIWVKREQVRGGVVTLRLANEDTELPLGAYRWDMRLKMDGEIVTPFTPRRFEVVEAVGDA
ncbi:MAG: hypothetical protein RSB91_05425 [Clostridia bacterium]